jgi:hypothetical protein
MKENERDFKKVLESIKSLEVKITSLETFVRESLVNVHEMDKQTITYQHKVNLDHAKQVGEIINIISAQTEAIQNIKEDLRK